MLAQISHCNSGSEICAFDEPGFWFLSISLAGYHEPHRHSGSYTHITVRDPCNGKKGKKAALTRLASLEPQRGANQRSQRLICQSMKSYSTYLPPCSFEGLVLAGVLDPGGKRLGKEDRSRAACSSATPLQARTGQRVALAGEPGSAARALLSHHKEQPARRNQNSRRSVSVRERRN